MRRQFGTEFNAWIEVAFYQTDPLDLKGKEKRVGPSHEKAWLFDQVSEDRIPVQTILGRRFVQLHCEREHLRKAVNAL